jgi:hypothetical protein
MASENNKSHEIPIASTPNPDQHWWFDEQRYSSSGSSSPPSQQFSFSSSPDPKVAIPLPSIEGWSKWRRDSLKISYHLDDFATPE